MFNVFSSVVSAIANTVTHIDECNPNVPRTIQADPLVDDALTVSVARLGFFGYTNDCGIWKGDRPSSTEEQDQKIWMWFRHRVEVFAGAGKSATVALVNFRRNDTNPNGFVLYKAVFPKNAPASLPFHFYKRQFAYYQGTLLEGERVKDCADYHWEMYTAVEFVDGDMRRMEEFFGSPGTDMPKVFSLSNDTVINPIDHTNPILEIYTTGYVRISEIERKVSDTQQATNANNKTPAQKREAKTETVLVEESVKVLQQTSYRLIHQNNVVAKWTVAGDNNANDIITPLFTISNTSSFFSRTTHKIITGASNNNNVVDCALAVLIAQICIEYFSKANILKKLPSGGQIPRRFPPNEAGGSIPFRPLPVLPVDAVIVQRRRLRLNGETRGPVEAEAAVDNENNDNRNDNDENADNNDNIDNDGVENNVVHGPVETVEQAEAGLVLGPAMYPS